MTCFSALVFVAQCLDKVLTASGISEFMGNVKEMGKECKARKLRVILISHCPTPFLGHGLSVGIFVLY